MVTPIRFRPSEGLRVLGHPAHALLVHLPLGLWVASAAWDALALAGVGPGAGELFSQVAFWSIAGGLLAAAPAAATGFLDLIALGKGRERAGDLATYHLVAMLSAAAAYGGSLVARGGSAPAAGGRLGWALALAGAGLALLAVGGWLGAELVYGHGVGARAARPRSSPGSASGAP